MHEIIKKNIVAELREGLLIKVLATEMARDTRTLATFIKNSNIPGDIRTQEGTYLLRFFEKFIEDVVRNPSSTSASIFARSGVTPRFKQVRCNVLNEMARNTKHISTPPLSKIHKNKRYNPGAQGHLIHISRTKGLTLGMIRTLPQNPKKGLS